MRADDITKALSVGQKWTRQVKSEEKRPSARVYRESMWTVSRTSLREICFEHMEEAWNKASGGGRLPTHWRQIFYVMRPICDDHPESDRPLVDATFKQILEAYLEEMMPGWDVLRGARGVFKEPHTGENLAMSTMGVRGYLYGDEPSPRIAPVSSRFPTKGAKNRIAAVLICEKEGFDALLAAEQVPERFDLALMSTKGISARAARDLAEDLDVPCFTLHDLDKNGFVMAGGFPFATDIGLRMDDVEKWGLTSEEQLHRNPHKTRRNLLKNGATAEEAQFVANGQRVELNMLTGPQFIEFVTDKLKQHGVEKVVPDKETLAVAWRRAHLARRVNALIEALQPPDSVTSSKAADPAQFLQVEVSEPPGDLTDRIRKAFDEDDAQSWDDALWGLVGESLRKGDS
jgi:hypothetical protein